jgi:hypothetical protein
MRTAQSHRARSMNDWSQCVQPRGSNSRLHLSTPRRGPPLLPYSTRSWCIRDGHCTHFCINPKNRLQLVEIFWTRPKNTRCPENTSKKLTHKDTHREIQETESVAGNSDYCEAQEEEGERGEMVAVRKRSADLPFLRRRRRRADRVSRAVYSWNLFTAVFPIPLPPIFPQPRLRSLQNCYRRLRFTHFHEQNAAFLPLFLANGDKGQQ